MTRSSTTLSLFAEPSNSPRRPSSIVLSMFAHAAIAGVAYYGVTHLPKIEDRALLEHYSVRRIDVLDPNFPHMPDLHQAENKIPYPGADVIRQLNRAPSPQLTEEMRSFLGQAAGRETLIQPDIYLPLPFAARLPLPNMMVWTPGPVAQKRIIPPVPDLRSAWEIKPSLAAPNQEIRPAETSIASTDLSTHREPVPAGSASLFQDRSVKPRQMAATNVAAPLESPTRAAVLSISEFRMLDGTVLLPPVNEVATANPVRVNAAEPASGRDGNLSLGGGGAKREDVADFAMDGRPLSTEHIVLPKNGRFSVVAVGSSLAEEYPQTADIWADRVAYTAYLHVGLRKSWILQYAATRVAEMGEGGRVERVDAPWPYDILRPNLLSRDVHADALMVHGVLNQAGRLESLAVAFPNSFRYTSFVLRALSQWQFRPAQRNGHATPVEVLLIIPEEMD